MFFKMSGGERKPTPKVEEKKSLGITDIAKLRELKNTLKKRHLFDAPGKRASWFDKDMFTEERGGAMFTIGEDEMKGFLGLTMDHEKGTAQIKSIRVESRDPELMKELLVKAISYLKDRSIHSVSVRVSEELKESAHVLHELDFHVHGEDGDGNRTYIKENL